MENLIHDLRIVNSKVDGIYGALQLYVDFKNDADGFKEHLEKVKEKVDDKQRANDKDSKGK